MGEDDDLWEGYDRLYKKWIVVTFIKLPLVNSFAKVMTTCIITIYRDKCRALTKHLASYVSTIYDSMCKIEYRIIDWTLTSKLEL